MATNPGPIKKEPLSLQSVDFMQLARLLFERKDLILNLAVVFISLMIALSIGNGYWAQDKKDHQTIVQAQEKSSLITDFATSKVAIDSFIKKSPKGLGISQMIDQTTKYASDNNIEIQSFNPAQKQVQNFYSENSMTLVIKAKTYKDLVMFIKTVNSCPYALRIKSCVLTKEGIKSAVVNEVVNAVIGISSIEINDHENTHL